MAKYVINRDYCFAGWEKLPFALFCKDSKTPFFLDKEQFHYIFSCNGYTDIDLSAARESTRGVFDFLLKKGVITEAKEGTGLQLHEYRKFPARYRRDVQLSITGRCNYHCKHCFQSAPHGLLGQPDTAQVLDIIDQLAECGVFEVSVTGGEPLIRPDFWEIIDRINEKGLRLTTVYSNGALIDQKLLDGFKKRGIKPSWNISFDGLGTHDFLRGVEGAEEKAVNAIKLLVREGYSVACSYTLTKRTAPVFRESIKFLAALGVHSVKTGNAMRQGEWMNHPEEWLTDEEQLGFYCEYLPQYIQDGRPLNLQCEGLFMGYSDAHINSMTANMPDSYSEDAVRTRLPKISFMHEKKLTEDMLGEVPACEVLRGSFYIGPTGRVLPCMSLEGTPAGNRFPSVFETRLSDIMRSSHFTEMTACTVKDVFDHNASECDNCEHRLSCAAGCRAAAVGASGEDYLACDKHTCMTLKENWTGKIRAAIAATELGKQLLDEISG